MRRLGLALAFVIVAGAAFAGGWYGRPPVVITETVTETVTQTVEVERKVPWDEPMLFGPEEFKVKFTEAMQWLKEVEPETYWHFAESIDQIVYTEDEYAMVVTPTRTILAPPHLLELSKAAIAGLLIHESVHVEQHQRVLETGVLLTREQQETEATIAEIEFYRRHGIDDEAEFTENALASRWWENLN